MKTRMAGSSPTMTNERGLPLFSERADFKLERPGAAGLLVELPVRGGDRRRRHQQIGIIKRFPAPHLLAALAHPCGVDAGIDDQVRDVDVLRSELAPHRLRHRAQSEFRAGEGRITAAATQGGGSTGEKDVALAARQHQPCRLAPGKKTGIAGHFPHLAEHPLGGLQDRKIDIGADVEDADFQRRVLVGVIEEGRDLLLLPRVQRAREDRSSGALDFLDQRLELGAIAPPREHGEPFGCEFLRDLGADVVAGTDHRGGCVAFFHFICSMPRHCEEQRDEQSTAASNGGMDRFAEPVIGRRFCADPLARNDAANHFPETSSSTSRNCSFPKNISLPTKKVGEPNAPRSTAACVFSISFALTSGSCARANSLAASRPEPASALSATSGSSIFFGSTHMWWNAASTYFSNTPSNCAATAAPIKLRVLTGKNGLGVYGFTAKRLTKRSVSTI